MAPYLPISMDSTQIYRYFPISSEIQEKKMIYRARSYVSIIHAAISKGTGFTHLRAQIYSMYHHISTEDTYGAIIEDHLQIL